VQLLVRTSSFPTKLFNLVNENAKLLSFKLNYFVIKLRFLLALIYLIKLFTVAIRRIIFLIILFIQ
jgi:hypothetical protein